MGAFLALASPCWRRRWERLAPSWVAGFLRLASSGAGVGVFPLRFCFKFEFEKGGGVQGKMGGIPAAVCAVGAFSLTVLWGKGGGVMLGWVFSRELRDFDCCLAFSGVRVSGLCVFFG